MNNNEQNDLSYQRIQQLIKKQLDRIDCYNQKVLENEMSAFM